MTKPTAQGFNPITELRDELGNFLSHWMPRTMDSAWDNGGWPFAQGAPAVDVEDRDAEIVVRAELPGMEKDQIQLEVDNGKLLIKGEKRREHETGDARFHRRECSYGRFERVVSLPDEVESGRADATYHNGVLTVRLPKTGQSRRKRIEVRSN